MTAGWVAATVRSQAMSRRRLGTAAARRLATGGSLPEALGSLARSPYQRADLGNAAPADRLAEAQREVAATLLWNLRVLSGWLPTAGVEQLRLLAGWFEIANVDEHLRALTARPAEPPFRLGSLATSWSRLAGTGSAAELRAALSASPWGDPGGTTDRDIALGMRLAWADRVAGRVPVARAWAHGGAALLVAREHLAAGAPLPERARVLAGRLLGQRWSQAGTPAELAEAVPPTARWALAGVQHPGDLWAAELGWWRRVRADGARLLAGRDPDGGAGRSFGGERVLGAVALLAVDCWLTRAALEYAARGGTGAAEVFDALA